MFSQVCVIPSVHGGGVADTPRQTPAPPRANLPRQTPPWANTPPDRQPPHEMATEAGGTHHTGMHSCLGLR